ncbi:MAG TPA: hypothetical protein VJR58_30160 [Vineibacter sp.]|nr:hypothetical protein [Vineibacter sp.]
MARSSLVAFLLLVGVLVLLFRGQTVADTVQRWGLPGTWAADCDRPASDSAPRIRYAMDQSGSAVVEHLHADTTRNSRASITGATIAADGTITLTIAMATPQSVRTINLHKAGNRIRSFSDRVAGAANYDIRDGRFTSGGSETPWWTRCDG